MAVLRYALSLITLILLVGPFASILAQSYPYDADTRPPRGIMPTSDQLTSPLDSIDPISGKVHLEIPLASLPRGSAGNGFELSLMYDSQLYDVVPQEATRPDGTHYIQEQLSAQFTTGGWTYNFENYKLEEELRLYPSWVRELQNPEGAHVCTDPDLGYQEHERKFRYRIGLPDGSLHILHLRGYEDPNETFYWADGFYGINIEGQRSECAATSPRYPANVTNGTLTYYTTDGSYLRLEIPVSPGIPWADQQSTLYLPNGRRVTLKNNQVLAIYDANTFNIHTNSNGSTDTTEGNRIYFERINGTQPVTKIRDDYGREIIIEKYYTQNPRQDRITAQGPNGTMEWRVNWTTFHIGDSNNPSYVCYYDNATNTNYTCAWHHDHTAVKYIQLPLERASTPNAPFTVPPTSWNSYEFDYSVNGPQKGAGDLIFMRTPSGAVYEYSTPPGLFYRQRDIKQDNVTYSWKWEFAGPNRRMTAPDGGQTTYYSYPDWMMNSWSRGLIYRIDEPNGKVTKRQWTRNKVAALLEETNKDPNNPYVEKESITEANRSAVTEYVVDKNGNLLKQVERDWTTYNGLSTVESGGPILRETEMIYHVAVPASTDTTEGINKYWQSGSPRRLDAVRRSTTRDAAGTVKAATEYAYDDPLKGGNVTFEYRWDNKNDLTAAAPGLGLLTPGNSVVLRRGYDTFGKGDLVDIFAPAVPTHLTYGNGPYPVRIEYATGATAYRRFDYDWNVTAGTLTSITDVQNSLTTSYTYDDAGRRKTVTEGRKSGTDPGVRRTQILYNDALRAVTVKRDLASLGDGALQTVTRYDRLGRIQLVQTSEGSAPTSEFDGIKVRTIQQFFNGGSRVITSTPYRSTTIPPVEATLEWTCTQRDQSGRVTAVAMFTAQPVDCLSTPTRTGITTTQYDVAEDMARTLVTDPAGKQAYRYYDALGRLKKVTEAPGSGADIAHTTYLYNALDNLINVTQGVQTRTFLYTSLGRLKSATNPETQNLATQYTYTDTGDLKTRTDPRGVVTTFSYDELHHVTGKAYSDGITPDVTYTYHTAATPGCYNIGQLLAVGSSVGGTTSTCYDQLGRVKNQTQTINGGPTAPFAYTYWLNDQIGATQYPSGRIATFLVDGAGRLNNVSVTPPGSTTAKMYAELATGIPYTADGRIARMKLGNDLWETWDYQTPNAPTVFKLRTSETSEGPNNKLQLEYIFSPTGNNGNLQSQVIRQPYPGDPNNVRSWTQEYTYDALNRLESACERPVNATASCLSGSAWWRHQYAYDRYGNRRLALNIGSNNTVVGGTDIHEPTLASDFQPETNRVFALTGNYDFAGNQRYYGPFALGYDAESRNTTAITGNCSTATDGCLTVAYDGDGRRVKKVWTSSSNTTTTTYYVYNVLGQLAVEYTTQAPTNGTAYFHTDLLGSVRMMTGEKPTNGIAPTLECYDYLPFGRLIRSTDNSRNTGCHPADPNQLSGRAPQKFTGKERDAETRLDYFGARYYSAAQGRFLSADKPFVDQYPIDPQSWNLYSYTRNNPLKYIDRDGEAVETVWDVLNIGLGIKSFVGNVRAGNYGSAALDAVGVVADSAATAVPFIPGGVGSLIKAARLAEKADDVVDAVRAIDRTDDAIEVTRAAENAASVGRTGKQARLREIAKDPESATADRGWIKQEMTQIERGKRESIRVPPGKELAHERGREAAKGYSYKHSHLQNKADHRTQHRYDNYGRKNKERTP